MWGFLVIVAIFSHGCFGDLIVEVEDGKVEGTSFSIPNGKTFYAWRGIPYAKPPVGKLRFQAPEKAEPWEGILDASENRSPCVTFRTPTLVEGESEDCLFINVYSPVDTNTTIDGSLDVMFWVYGGAYTRGSGDFSVYDPSPLLNENVMVVTFNYRLGPLGFLSTGDETVPGNAAIRDQLLALQWTRKNIASFGGNPESITVFGESAGAMSIGYHLLSSQFRGLFKGAIMESGSGLSNTFQQNPRENVYKLAKEIDSTILENSALEDVIEILLSTDTNSIVAAFSSANVQFGPVFEPISDSAIITGPNYEQLVTGDFSRVPIIIGHNSLEAIYYNNDLATLQQSAKSADTNPERFLPNIPLIENVSRVAIGNEIRDQYVGENQTLSENLAAYLEVSSSSFTRVALKHALLHSEFAPAYLYEFTYYGTPSYGNLNLTGAERKVGHSQEMSYLFNFTEPIATDADYLTRNRMVRLWANFAKTSNPTPDDDSLLQNLKWEPVQADNVLHLVLDDNLELKQKDLREIEFWDSIWSRYSYHPYYIY